MESFPPINGEGKELQCWARLWLLALWRNGEGPLELHRILLEVKATPQKVQHGTWKWWFPIGISLSRGWFSSSVWSFRRVPYGAFMLHLLKCLCRLVFSSACACGFALDLQDKGKTDVVWVCALHNPHTGIYNPLSSSTVCACMFRTHI